MLPDRVRVTVLLPRPTSIYHQQAIEVAIRRSIYEWFSDGRRFMIAEPKFCMVDDVHCPRALRGYLVSIDLGSWSLDVQDAKAKAEALADKLSDLFSELQIDDVPTWGKELSVHTPPNRKEL
jgi:hypothetical protein